MDKVIKYLVYPAIHKRNYIKKSEILFDKEKNIFYMEVNDSYSKKRFYTCISDTDIKIFDLLEEAKEYYQFKIDKEILRCTEKIDELKKLKEEEMEIC